MISKQSKRLIKHKKSRHLTKYAFRMTRSFEAQKKALEAYKRFLRELEKEREINKQRVSHLKLEKITG